tara:strand:- start:144 stop:1025 length:882 start_codon:yes stop_codon:yes gene_type:complete
MKRLLIVDFHALLHRSRNAMMRTGRDFRTSDGIPTSGVFSLINNLLSCIKLMEPTHVVVTYDAGGNTRKGDSSTYKANRTGPSDDFKTEMSILLDEGLYSLGIECIGIKGYEADDLIYTIAHVAQFGMDRMDEIIIWTCDQDLLQCVTERVKVLLFNSAKTQKLMAVNDVIEKWGCEPADILLVKAIAGDASDNISGVPRIGMKTAVKILEEYGWDLLAALDHKKLKGYDELIKDNLHLVTLRRSWELAGAIRFEDWKLGKGIAGDYGDFLQRYEFTSLQKRLRSTITLMQLQ